MAVPVLVPPAALPRPLHTPEPSPVPPPRAGLVQILVTALVVVGPLLATALAAAGAWGAGVTLFDLVLGAGLYTLAVLGVTAGYHRLFTHRSYVARRPLKIGLAVSGSLALEGSLMSWVVNHRRHHRYSDRAGDPHSPVAPSRSLLGGLLHAHVGWLFRPMPVAGPREPADLLVDRDLVLVSRAFPLWAVVTFALPFFLGWAVTGTLGGALTTLLWAGLVRVFLVHHVTWSINSICHVFGKRPFDTGDRAANVWPLALVSMGESWHNAHHAFPTLARHGVDRAQLDVTAACIRLWERLGWAHSARWPRAEQLARRRTRADAA